MTLTLKQGQALLSLSRQVLLSIVNGAKAPIESCPDKIFQEKAGVFISLHKGIELRGCIGTLEPVQFIWESVQENTRAAATQDFRFAPVASEELDKIKIEISILTPPQACSLNEIIPNKDGVIIQQGARRATYLPQVWESLSDPKEFFGTLCEKAGLSADCWQDKQTKFFRYQALVFRE